MMESPQCSLSPRYDRMIMIRSYDRIVWWSYGRIITWSYDNLIIWSYDPTIMWSCGTTWSYGQRWSHDPMSLLIMWWGRMIMWSQCGRMVNVVVDQMLQLVDRARDQSKNLRWNILLYESPPAETRLTVYRRLQFKMTRRAGWAHTNSKSNTVFGKSSLWRYASQR